MTYTRLALGLAALLLTASLAAGSADAASKKKAAPAFDDAKEYADCMALAQRAPENALKSAAAWAKQQGGDAADHCTAVALVTLSRFPEAAELLEQLAGSLQDRRRPLAANLYRQAGAAWQMAGDVKRAAKAQTAGLRLAPKDADMLVDRAASYAGMGQYWEAIDDLNKAQELAPKRADILVLRGTAYRYVGSPELAAEDIAKALRLDPRNPEALVERGTQRRLANDRDGARADWLQAANLAAGTPTGDVAQAKLEQLDLKANSQ